ITKKIEIGGAATPSDSVSESKIPIAKLRITDRVSETANASEIGVAWVREVCMLSDSLKLSLRVNPRPNVANRTESVNPSVSDNNCRVGTAKRIPSENEKVSDRGTRRELASTLASDRENTSDSGTVLSWSTIRSLSPIR